MKAALGLLIILPLAAQSLRLEDLEKMALAASPSLAQTEAGVRAAAGRARQAGLYPNPVLGATGDEISQGPIIRGGEYGGFVEQRVVTARKLGLSRRAADKDRLAAEEMQKSERLRVLTRIRTLYYRALGEQRLIAVRREMADLAARTASTFGELANIGQADRPDLLAAEVDSQRANLAATMAQNALDRTWREITALVNQPSLQPVALEGDLEALPKLDPDQTPSRILSESPELREAQIGADRGVIAAKRARAERIPDLNVRGGVRYNRELLEQSHGGLSPVGTEGFFDVGVEIPIFNRNQGAIAAADAEADRARLEADRLRLALRRRFAGVYKEYSDAAAAVALYRTEMIPRARQAFDMYTGNFRQMSAAYPQVLAAQRSLIQIEDDYIAQLIAAWQAAVEIDGLLVLD